MPSLVTNPNSSTAQEIVNWVTTADGCVHTADTTQLDSWRCVFGISDIESDLGRTNSVYTARFGAGSFVVFDLY